MATRSSALSGQNLQEWSLPWQKPTFEILREVLEAVPDAAMVLDDHRRVLLANDRLLRSLTIPAEQVAGRRPGEAIGCLFATESPDGCGSGLHCSVCGALRSILQCQELKDRAVEECQILLGGEEGTTLDLEVTATYAVIEGKPVTLCVLRDVSTEKRRSVLERLFFHDVLNTVGGIHGLAELLNEPRSIPPGQETHYKRWVLDLSKRLIDEIVHQRKLMAAERGEFTPELGLVAVDELAREVKALFAGHEVAEERYLELGELCAVYIMSDPQILRRILANLVKNAFEATRPGETVTISCYEEGGMVTFAVHNPGVICRDVQLQLFRRSFSTKGGEGRGLGTYSVKLFCERYLQGRVSFSSSEAAGTTFTVTLPKKMSNS